MEVWSRLGAVTQSKNTYATMKGALDDSKAPYADKSFESFLQGSYGNDTNVWADSDVDVVIRLTSTFYYDIDQLPDAEKQQFHTDYGSAASYGLTGFKTDVASWLTTKFGSNVTPGSKAIFVPGSGSRRDSDVLPAATFRRYITFRGLRDTDYVEGICFHNSAGTRIENFPKQHSENCTTKHQGTGQYFKPMVRILKNMRNKMIENGVLQDGIAPSYYLEGLLYNAPNGFFGRSYSDSFVNCMNWILQADRTQFVCANEQHFLIRDGSLTSWGTQKCSTYLNAVTEFWKNW